MAQVLPPDIVSRVKEETDIVALVRGYVSLQPTGSAFKGLCPFHREKTPSFHVNPDRQIYKCFGCGEGGDAISFLMKIEGIGFPEAIEALARPLDIDLSRFLREDESEGERQGFHRANEAAAGLFRDALWGGPGAAARKYLQGRGFGEESLRRFDVGWAPPDPSWLGRALGAEGVDEAHALRANLLRVRPGRPQFAYFRRRIIFPIKNIAQRVAGFGGRVLDGGEPKYLNSPDSEYFSKKRLLYGFAASRIAIARLRTAILVEGYLDLLALAQAGLNNAVATCGTAFTKDQARLLRRGCRSLVLLFDGDSAGLQAAVRAGHTALAAGLEPRIARLPAGEDPASLLAGRDRAALEEVLGAARGYLPFLAHVVQERGGGRQGMERALRQGLRSIAEVADPIKKEYLLQEASELFGIGLPALRQALAGAQARGARRADGPDAEPEAGTAGATDGAARTGRPVRTGRARAYVDGPAIERDLLAHVLRDATGRAARTLLAEDGEECCGTPQARDLCRALTRWAAEAGDVPPGRWVQDHWHQADGSYRNYVSDLLTREDVPEQTDFVKVVRDALARLRQSRGRAGA